MAVILLLGVVIFVKERAKKRAGTKFWISLIKLGIVMLFSTSVGIMDTLDHNLRPPRDCLPFDSTFPALTHDQDHSSVVRGLVQLIARIVLYTLPSLALLSLFHSGRPSVTTSPRCEPSTSFYFQNPHDPNRVSITESLLAREPRMLPSELNA
eukprot:754994-Hanusia_phi.AAC.14